MMVSFSVTLLKESSTVSKMRRPFVVLVTLIKLPPLRRTVLVFVVVVVCPCVFG